MCTCEHVEVICQVTRVLKSGQVPGLELIPHSWVGNSWGVPGGGEPQTGLFSLAEREPGAALVTKNGSISCITGFKAGTGAATSSVSELVLFPEMMFVVWMRKMSKIL